MKGLAPLFLGIFGTFAFSWIGLTVIPTWQIGHLNPESDEEGTDIYPRPQSGMFNRGAHVYAANGCVYCHSQQVRADYIADDIERKWGNRRSAPRDYILIGRYFSEKCEWARTLQTLARAHLRPRNRRRLREQPVLRGRLQLRERQLRRLRRPPHHPQVRLQLKERRSPVRRRRKQLRLHQQLRLRLRVRRQQRLQRRPGLRLPARLRQMHHRRRDSGPASLRRHPDKWRTLLREEAALSHRVRRRPARRGRSRQPVCRRCILPRGTMCIFTRRAASILIQTCRRIVSFTKNDTSPESVLQRRCNFRVPMRHRKAGRLFPRTMQNVSWLI